MVIETPRSVRVVRVDGANKCLNRRRGLNLGGYFLEAGQIERSPLGLKPAKLPVFVAAKYTLANRAPG